MYRIPNTLGGNLLGFLFVFGVYAALLLSSTNLLWHGVAAQGVIVGEDTVSCAKSRTKTIFSVQFTDQTTGLADTSTISQCDYGGFNASPGDSVAIVYLPDNPTEIAPPDGLLANVQFDQFMTILTGLLTLILLPLWIRKRIREASLQRQEEQASAERLRVLVGSGRLFRR